MEIRTGDRVFYQPYGFPGADVADAREGIVAGIQYDANLADPIILLNGVEVEAVPSILFVMVKDSETGHGYYAYPNEIILEKDVTSWLNG